jgi:hypothetical protein
MDRVESLCAAIRRAARFLYGANSQFADLFGPGNHELLLQENKSKAKRTPSLHDFAKAMVVLEALEAGMPRAALMVAARGADAAAGGLAIVPVRMRPPRELATLRAAAAGYGPDPPPWWNQWVVYLKANVGYMMMMVAVLFPRLTVAVLVRTVRAMVGQFLSEFGGMGFDAAGNLVSQATQTMTSLEDTVLLTTNSAIPNFAGASLIAVLAACSRFGGARLPALPP